MRKIYVCLVALVALTIVGCSHDEMNEVADASQLIRIHTTIGEPSRAVVGIDGKGYFEDGDGIGLYVNSSHRNAQMQGGQWTPAPSWDEIYGPTATFSAFYPDVNHWGSAFKHTVHTRQDLDNNFEQSDLLYAGEVTVNRGQDVHLQFAHVLSGLTVTLRSNHYTADQLAQAVVKVKGYNAIDVRPDGTLGKLYDYRHGVNNIPEITLRHQQNGVFQAVMCPQSVHELDYGSWWLSITIAGKHYTRKEAPVTLNDGRQFNRFEAGQNVNLIYNFNGKDLEFANKTCWVEGIQGIPEPGSPAWKLVSNLTTQKYLPYKPEYGWFDCSKKSTTDSEYNDMNKCWAATASNMIHWWLIQNDSYVQRYCQQKGISYDDIPHRYVDHHNTDVFQLFRDKFTDKGSFAKNGLDWYFLGHYQAALEAAQLINPHVESAGFFKDVFGSGSSMIEHHAIIDMNSLSSVLKDAFKHRQAIGFSILLPGFGSAHAMTIWGAKFDENGTVCAIYYVDNNDGPIGETSIGLIEARVGEYEGTKYPQNIGRACMENSYGKIEINIQDIDLLNLRQDDWKQYFAE